MAIFPVLETESVVQVGDKTRLDATKSFISKGENPVVLVRIRPEASASFITVTGNSSKDWFLDWIYETSGAKQIDVEITTDTTPSAPLVVTKSYTLEVVTAAQDKLFSSDKDLIEYETDILKWVRPGRSSWLDFHRKAQELIVDWINRRGHVSTGGTKLTKDAFVDLDEVREMSVAYTLHLIFNNLSNATDDVFSKKSQKYFTMLLQTQNRVALRLDLDGNASIDQAEYIMPTTSRMLRR